MHDFSLACTDHLNILPQYLDIGQRILIQNLTSVEFQSQKYGVSCHTRIQGERAGLPSGRPTVLANTERPTVHAFSHAIISLHPGSTLRGHYRCRQNRVPRDTVNYTIYQVMILSDTLYTMNDITRGLVLALYGSSIGITCQPIGSSIGTVHVYTCIPYPYGSV